MIEKKQKQKNKILVYKNNHYQQEINGHNKQSGITIENPTPYNETFDHHHPNNVNILPLSKLQQSNTSPNIMNPHIIKIYLTK